MISDEDKDKVRAATDLVELVQETVELKPRGSEFWGCCMARRPRRFTSFHPRRYGIALVAGRAATSLPIP